MTVDDPQTDLVDPAVKGTRNVLNEATRTKTVKRVVVTSSVGAICTDASDTYKAPNNVLTEQVWNMSASLDYQPYFFSKTMAEHAAWEVAGGQTQWSLVTINPAFVMGPGVKYHSTSESFKVCKSLGGGEMAYGAPQVSVGVVDVREVAQTHIVAAYSGADEVQGRFILCAENTDFYEMAQAMIPSYGKDYPIPTRTVPKFVFKMMAPWIGFSRQYVENNVGVPINFDNTKSKQVLGIEYRSLQETMTDMFQQLIDEGVVKKSGE